MVGCQMLNRYGGDCVFQITYTSDYVKDFQMQLIINTLHLPILFPDLTVEYQ
jgi:hypothetical protein